MLQLYSIAIYLLRWSSTAGYLCQKRGKAEKKQWYNSMGFQFHHMKHSPGDSSRDPFNLPVGGHLNHHLKGHFFTIPKKVTIAEWPNSWKFVFCSSKNHRDIFLKQESLPESLGNDFFVASFGCDGGWSFHLCCCLWWWSRSCRRWRWLFWCQKREGNNYFRWVEWLLGIYLAHLSLALFP